MPKLEEGANAANLKNRYENKPTRSSLMKICARRKFGTNIPLTKFSLNQKQTLPQESVDNTFKETLLNIRDTLEFKLFLCCTR